MRLVSAKSWRTRRAMVARASPCGEELAYVVAAGDDDDGGENTAER